MYINITYTLFYMVFITFLRLITLTVSYSEL